MTASSFKELAIHWTGVVTLTMLAAFSTGAAIFWFFQWWFGPYGPQFHFGRPECEGRLAFYSRQQIITRKGGERLSDEEIAKLPKILNHWFAIPWFVGISTRKGHFLFGFIRLVRQ